MGKDLNSKILKKLEKQLIRMLLIRLDKSSLLNQELEKSGKKVLSYIKTLQSPNIKITEHDETILECLLLRNHSLILPIIFGIFTAWFAGSSMNALLHFEYETAIIALFFTSGIIILAKLLTNTQSREMLDYSLLGALIGILIPNITFKTSSTYVLSDPLIKIISTSGIFPLKTLLVLAFPFLILLILEQDLKFSSYFKRNALRRVYEIYMHHQKRIDDIYINTNN